VASFNLRVVAWTAPLEHKPAENIRQSTVKINRLIVPLLRSFKVLLTWDFVVRSNNALQERMSTKKSCGPRYQFHSSPPA